MNDSSSRADVQTSAIAPAGVGHALPPDPGPWLVNVWPGQKVVLQSDCFEHDVALIIDGDFGSYEDKLAYANAMAAWMNSNLPAAPNRLSPAST